jgi:hypothetical protein
MRLRRFGIVALFVVSLLSAALAFQRRFSRFSEDEYLPLPPDANEKTEFAFARLRYSSLGGGYYRLSNWSTDYPKADRQFVQGVRRLTRLHTRSVEQVVSFEGNELFDYPWIYAVEVGHWELNEEEAAKLREYLLRGGFLMTDDFHGSMEWEIFLASIRRVFPDRPIVDIPDNDPIFHTIYDIKERYQVPVVGYIYSGRTYERDGYNPEWKGIYDDHGRVMVAICHNMDLGDAWEWADEPRYPEKFASLAYRLGINYIIYAMSH